jgi:hypothetical protein
MKGKEIRTNARAKGSDDLTAIHAIAGLRELETFRSRTLSKLCL